MNHDSDQGELPAGGGPTGQNMSCAARKGLYWLLIAVAVGGATGRVLAVNSIDMIRLEDRLVEEQFAKRKAKLTASGETIDEPAERARIRAQAAKQRPFLSGNDRSRWCTVRALVERGTYEIDEIVQEPNWDTIDMVQHRGRDGELHLYSSKPPLLATLYAAEYWLIHQLTGKTLGTHPFEIGRFMLWTLNVVPFALYLWLVSRLVERFGGTDWGRMLVFAGACFGTYLTTFVITLNNHLHAAVCVAVALYATVRIWSDGETRKRYFILAGLAAAFAAANELPALSFLGLLGLGLLVRFPRPTLMYFTPSVGLVAAAFFFTNYLAHSTWIPPYAFGGGIVEQKAERPSVEERENWYDYSYIRKSDGKRIESYWRNPKGIDVGEKDPAWYAVHVLVGHHGIFSLTPLWLLAIPGTYLLWRNGVRGGRELALFIATLTIVCLVFYLTRDQGQRNYGGMTSAFRWVFWLAPLWLVAATPAADAASKSRAWRIVGYVLLGLSVLSASTPTWNPWTLPWPMKFAIHMGWTTL